MCRKLDKFSQLNLMIKINLFPETSKNTKVKRKLIQFLAKLAVGLAQWPSGGSESPSTTGPIVPNSSLLSARDLLRIMAQFGGNFSQMLDHDYVL